MNAHPELAKKWTLEANESPKDLDTTEEETEELKTFEDAEVEVPVVEERLEDFGN